MITLWLQTRVTLILSFTENIVLFSIIITINIGIAIYFVSYKYINRNEENVYKYDYVYQPKKYLIKLVKNIQKIIQEHWYLQHWIYYN